MMQEKKIEPIVAVEDHGGVFDVTMGNTPFAPAMAEWRQSTRQGKGIFLMNSLYILDGDIRVDLTHTCQNESGLLKIMDRQVTGCYKSLNGYVLVPSIQHVQRCCSCTGSQKVLCRQAGANVRYFVGTWSHHAQYIAQYSSHLTAHCPL
jgi:hypothetical protein